MTETKTIPDCTCRCEACVYDATIPGPLDREELEDGRFRLFTGEMSWNRYRVLRRYFYDTRGEMAGAMAKQRERLDSRLREVRAIEQAYAQCGSIAEEALLLAMFESSKVEDPSHDLVAGLAQQHEVNDYRLDFAWPDDRVAVEVDGFRFHDRDPKSFVADRVRDRSLLREGWLILRFGASEVLDSSARCTSEILSVLQARRQGAR